MRLFLRYKFNDTKKNATKQRPSIDAIPSSVLQDIRNMNYFDTILYKKIKLL
jgi:hypothetical protein